MTFMVFVPLHLFLCLLALSITISGKWLLLGKICIYIHVSEYVYENSWGERDINILVYHGRY
jgi:hypothetical protein